MLRPSLVCGCVWQFSAMGSHPQPEKAFDAGMDWAPGDSWSLDTALPGGEYDFKFVVQRQDGSAGEWEPGANRTIKVAFLLIGQALRAG